MTDAECREMLWRVSQSGNPNKAWICDDTGARLSALMTLKAAREIACNHNQTVKFLMNHIEKGSQ
ncbi:hypothetical protein [Zavarzinella formosa]|uniref:hypothetical protein n=1 Tax=Zavarzinella formosa TaxID=360055 RepID=UPI00031DF061|nr:hypothetical protein [Zavarzinella formosa]